MERRIFKREAAQRLLRLLPHGSRRAFAEAIGITPQALSRWLNPEDPQAPRLPHIWAIGAQLLRQKVPSFVVRELLVLFILSDPDRAPLLLDEGFPESLTPRGLVEEVESALHPPMRWLCASDYGRWLRRIRERIRALERLACRLSPSDPWSPLLRTCQVALWLAAANSANALDRLEEALEWGQRARHWAWHLLQSDALRDPWLRSNLGRGFYRIGSWILSAVWGDCSAWYNSGCPEIAWDHLEQGAVIDPEAWEATAPWKSQFRISLTAGRLAYASAAQALSFREIQSLYGEGERLLEGASLPNPHFFRFHAGLIRYAVWALLRREKVPSSQRRWARRQLEPVLRERRRLDPLAQILILRAWGELRWRDEEREEAVAAIREAIVIARQYHLHNQLRKIREAWEKRLSGQN